MSKYVFTVAHCCNENTNHISNFIQVKSIVKRFVGVEPHVELEDDCILQQGFDDPQCDRAGTKHVMNE